MSYSAIETFIVHALNARGIKPSYVKGTHMSTGSLFIIMPSLKEAYDLIEMIQETSLDGSLRAPEPITIDWSHAQSTLFKTYLGHVPSKVAEWPLPGISTKATLPPTKSLQQADLDSLRLATVQQSAAKRGYGSGRGASCWGDVDPHLTEHERFMRWRSGAYKVPNEEDSQHSLFQSPGDHTWLGGGKAKAMCSLHPPSVWASTVKSK